MSENGAAEDVHGASPQGQGTLRLAFCGERRLFLDAVAKLLVRRGHQVTASASTVMDLLPQLPDGGVDVVVIDHLKRRTGAEVASLREVDPDAVVMIIGSADVLESVSFAVIAPRSIGVDALVALVEQAGGVSSPAEMSPGVALPPLTKREHDVLRRLSSGETTAELARGLGIAESTAREHVQNVLRKLGVHTRAHAVSLALGEGLL